MTVEKNEELESLRLKIRALTSEIIMKAQERTDLARQVGEVKGKLGMDIKDERVEQEICLMVAKQAEESRMDKEFALRLLSVLLRESEQVQEKSRPQKTRQTHLGIFRKAKQMEASGRRIIHLEVGEPDYPAPAPVGDALTESFAKRQYNYTDTRGLLALRDALASKSGVTEERVMVTPGGRFAVFSAIVSLVRPGEEIITIEPAWPAYKECANFIGARTRVLKTTLENDWTPDIAELASMVSENTKMIAINYPNNPTGKVIDEKTMDRIVGLARDYRLYLLSDEVYSDYSFVPSRSVLTYDYERSIVVSSFSKTYAMTGFRIGYAVALAETIKQMAKVQAAGITSVAEPIQRAALAALGQDTSINIDLMKKRLAFLTSQVKKMSLRFVQPGGAMYVYPKLPAGKDIDLVERLLKEGVAIAPGSGFGDSYSEFVRISACRPEEEMAEGLTVMAKALGQGN